MSVCCILEPNLSELNAAAWAVLAAGQALGQPLTVQVFGQDCQAVAQQAAIVAGVEKVLVAEHADLAAPVAEQLMPVLQAQADQFSHILMSATTFGKNCLPRLAALCNVSPITDVVAIDGPNDVVRLMYAGNVLVNVHSDQALQLFSVRVSAFAKQASTLQVTANDSIAESVAQVYESTECAARFVKHDSPATERPALVEAKVVLTGGRGFQSSENFKQLEALADRVGAAVGATRAAVDAGYVPNDYQVGQTGQVVAPDLYMAFGVSGAIQHVAGMSGSRVVVAINQDADAPIFSVADYGLVMDLFEALPQFEQALAAAGQLTTETA